MSLESGSYIANLNPANPAPNDPKSQGDDHIRLIKDVLQKSFPGFSGAIVVTGTDGGVANAYTLTPSPALPSYVDRMIVVFSPTVANTGASTLNISSLGTLQIRSVDGQPMVANDLAAGSFYIGFRVSGVLRLIGVTKRYVDAMAFATALPAQSLGFLRSDGANASFGQTHSGYAQKEVRGGDIASAATIDLTPATGNYVHITGSAGPVTAITIASGAEYTLYIEGTPTFNHSATLLLPGSANITARAGDRLIVRGDISGAVVVSYIRSDGLPVAFGGYLKVSDRKASGTSGGTNTIGTHDRTFNTIDINTISGANLASNVVTLPAGTYEFQGRAPGIGVLAQRAFLFNDTDAVFALLGA